jgi:hypothetical protein
MFINLGKSEEINLRNKDHIFLVIIYILAVMVGTYPLLFLILEVTFLYINIYCGCKLPESIVSQKWVAIGWWCIFAVFVLTSITFYCGKIFSHKKK